MNRISRFFAISAFALMILGLPAIASAQWGNRDRDDDYGNGRYNRNLRATIQNLKNRARNFENVTNRVEDRRDDRDDRYDDRYERPTEVDALIGDASKARDVLGWKAQTEAKGLAELMVDADIELLSGRLKGIS